MTTDLLAPPLAPADNLLSLREVAGILKCTPRYVNKLILHKRIPAITRTDRIKGGFKRQHFVHRREVLRWIRDNNAPGIILDQCLSRRVLIIGMTPISVMRLRKRLGEEEGWKVDDVPNLLRAGIMAATNMPLAAIINVALTGPDPSAVQAFQQTGCTIIGAIIPEDCDRPQEYTDAGFSLVVRQPLNHDALAAQLAAVVRERVPACRPRKRRGRPKGSLRKLNETSASAIP